jgi:hypothetical protein
MKDIQLPIGLTSAVLFIYVISPLITPIFAIVFTLFLITNAMIIWMVIRVLKDGQPSSRTFDEYFYDTVDIKRVK